MAIPRLYGISGGKSRAGQLQAVETQKKSE